MRKNAGAKVIKFPSPLMPACVDTQTEDREGQGEGEIFATLSPQLSFSPIKKKMLKLGSTV
ncbi:MAG TPA: hypothetical protein PLQ41_00205 [bacterium]|nr:hypothetical protein [bacterium]HPP29798.1 hypothetical protein [bacterium]